MTASGPSATWPGPCSDDQLSLDLATRAGINCEALAVDAEGACYTQNLHYVEGFMARVPEIVAGAITTTTTQTRSSRDAHEARIGFKQRPAARGIHLVRLVRHPRRARSARPGTVVIVAQLVLTMPSLAAQLEGKVA